MTKETDGIIMARVRNQLRIHWGWLKEKDYDEVANFIDAWMRQALRAHPKIITEKIENKDKEIDKWANQKVNIECNMLEAGNLMDILFMADGGPFDEHFRATLKLNNMEDAYSKWLDKMVHIVCKEEFESDKLSKISQVKRKIKRP